MRHVTSIAGRLAVLTACHCLLVGCIAQIKPWERGTLAKPQMALVPDPQNAAIMQHTYTSKETSSGGYGVGGGGCGCN